MSLSVGIIGLPNAGKSTLFNALLGKRQAQVAAYPFTTIEPNTGVAEVPDQRFDQLVSLIKPRETRPAAITFVDIAGLVAGAHRGEGLGNQFLAHIRETDAMIHVINAFSQEANVRDDLETVRLELTLKDFETASRKREQLEKKAGGKKKTLQVLTFEQVVEEAAAALGEGRLVRELSLTKEKEAAVRELFLLTMKPEVVVINVTEEALIEDQAIEFSGIPQDTEVVVLSAKAEMDLAELEPAEQEEYRRETGLGASRLNQVVSAGYRALDLITFYTIKGGQIAQAWPVRRGLTLWEAAGQVHTDLAERFIVAEVIPVSQFLSHHSWVEAKKAGAVRTYGREDLVEDSWVIEIKT